MNNMQILPISFGARIKLKKAKDFTADSSILSSGSSTIGSILGSGSTAIATKSAVGATNTVGSAFSAQASGINSFGIAPSVVESVTPYATPATVVFSNNHPGIIGTFFSSLGSWLNSFTKVSIKIKDPS